MQFTKLSNQEKQHILFAFGRIYNRTIIAATIAAILYFIPNFFLSHSPAEWQVTNNADFL